jgi:Zn-dependent metalloprotease
MADPPRYLQPDTTSSPMFDFAQDYDDSGAVHTNSGVPNKVAYLITDGTVAEPGGAFLGRAFPASARPTPPRSTGPRCRC